MATSPYPTLKRPATFDHLLAKPANWRIVEVCDDVAAANALQEAQDATGMAELTAGASDADEADDEALRAAQDVEAKAKAAYDAKCHQVLMVAVGGPDYDDMLERLRKQDADAAVVEGAALNGDGAAAPEKPWPDKFPATVVAISMRQPSITAEQAEQIQKAWNGNEFGRLFAAAMEVNGKSVLVTLGKGSGVAPVRR